MAKQPDKNKKPALDGEEDPSGEAVPAMEPVKSRMPGKVIVLYIVLPVIVLLLGGGSAAYFMGMFDASSEEHANAEGESGDHGEGENHAVFYEIPEILVNLNGSGKKETYLKIRIALELENEKTQLDLEPLMPRVIDNFQVFLREMRVEDLSGSAGMVRLKEELLQRINLSVQPLKVRDVLFKEMLIQ